MIIFDQRTIFELTLTEIAARYLLRFLKATIVLILPLLIIIITIGKPNTQWLEYTVRYFDGISVELAALVTLTSLLFGAKDESFIVFFKKLFTRSNNDNPKHTSYAFHYFEGLINRIEKFFRLKWIKLLSLAVAIFFCSGLLFDMKDSLLILVTIFCLIIVARAPLANLIGKELRVIASRQENFWSKIYESRFLTKVGVVVAMAAMLAFGTKSVYYSLFANDLISIVISRFETTSSDDEAIAEEFRINLSHYMQKILVQENILFDVILVNIDITIRNPTEAEKLGREYGQRAIVVWGLISKSTYTPQFTFINPPKGLVLSQTKQSEIIRDLNNIHGQALNLASNTRGVVNFAIGLIQYWNNNYSAGLQLFEEAYEQDPSNNAILLYIGNCQYFLGLYDRAASTYQTMIINDPDAVAPLNNLAAIQIEQGEYENALRTLEKTRRLNERLTAALVNTAVVYREFGQPEESQRYFAAALRVEPDNPVVLNNIAVSAERVGDSATALLLLENVTKSDEAPQEAFINLGFLYYQQKKYTEALVAFSKANRMVPEDTTAAFGITLVYLTTGKTKDAQKWMAKVIEKSKSPGKHYQQFGDALYKAQLYDDAISLYRQSLHSNPSLISNYARMAQCAHQLKKEEEALSYTIIYTSHNPSREDAETLSTFHLGCVLSFNLGKLDTALDMCGRVYRIQPQNQEYSKNYAHALLRYAIVNGDSSKISEFFSVVKGLALSDSEQVEYNGQLGNFYLSLESYAHAINHYRKVLTFAPENEIARHNLPIAYHKQADDFVKRQQWQNALSAYDQAFEAYVGYKDKAIILYQKAYLFQQQGNIEALHNQLRQFINYAHQHNLQKDMDISRSLENAKSAYENYKLPIK